MTNPLKLNYNQNHFFNQKSADQKTSLQLDGGMLKYKTVQDILEVDVSGYEIWEKRSNVSIYPEWALKSFLDEAKRIKQQ